MDNDKLKITIRIADVAPLSLNIDRGDQEAEAIARTAEVYVNQQWKAKRMNAKYSDMDSKDILAMVAYEFAKLYCIYKENANEMVAILENFEKDLDDVLLKVD